MQRWCEGNSHCVGFAAWVDGQPGVFGHAQVDGWLFPKERNTGFDEASAKFVEQKHPTQVWHWYYIKERAQPHLSRARSGTEDSIACASETSLVNAATSYTPLSPQEVPTFLGERGFPAKDTEKWFLSGPQEWAARMPALRFSITSHEEAGHHTWYTVVTFVEDGDGTCLHKWKAPRRLMHLRQFHDHLRHAAGPAGYEALFTNARGERVHFASRGGVPGTTAKLHAWFGTMAARINSGLATPSVVANALHFLRAPPFNEGQDESEGEQTAEKDLMKEDVNGRWPGAEEDGDGASVMRAAPGSPLACR